MISLQAGQVGLGYSTGLFSVPGYTVQHPAQHRPSSRDTQPGDSAAIRHPSGGRWGQLLLFKYTIRSIVCEASCHPVTWVTWVTWVILVIRDIREIRMSSY